MRLASSLPAPGRAGERLLLAAAPIRLQTRRREKPSHLFSAGPALFTLAPPSPGCGVPVGTARLAGGGSAAVSPAAGLLLQAEVGGGKRAGRQRGG